MHINYKPIKEGQLKIIEFGLYSEAVIKILHGIDFWIAYSREPYIVREDQNLLIGNISAESDLCMYIRTYAAFHSSDGIYFTADSICITLSIYESTLYDIIIDICKQSKARFDELLEAQRELNHEKEREVGIKTVYI